jgi:putative chitinase
LAYSARPYGEEDIPYALEVKPQAHSHRVNQEIPMSAITAQQVRDAAKGRVNKNDLASVLVALGRYGDRFGPDRPHRLAQYFAQLMHESGDFPYDQEIWGADAGPAAL